MRVSLILIALTVLLPRASAEEPAPLQPEPFSRLRLRVVGRNLEVPPHPGGTRRLLIFAIDGQRITTLDEFKAAVQALSRGTELLWVGDCVHYGSLPVAGPKTAISELQAFCLKHGVTFTYLLGGY